MGCGTVADYGHIPVLKSTDGLILHAVFEPNPVRLQQMQKKHGIDLGFTDEKSFFESGIDAVSITSPAPCHLANIQSACKYGKHILCEKPLGTSERQCRESIDMAKKANVMLFTGFDYRFSPVALRIRDLIWKGDIGDLKSLRLIYIWNCHGKGAFDENGCWIENKRRQAIMQENGPMADCGVHQIDLARFWSGSEIVSWSEAGAWVDEYDAPDHMYLHMDHANGAHTMIELSYSYCHTCQQPVNLFTYDLIGTKGIIRYDRGTRLFEMRNDKGVFTYGLLA